MAITFFPSPFGRWRGRGCFALVMPRLALRRIATRVKHGGHDVPRADVLRRFNRSSTNFYVIYRLLADAWLVYDNSGAKPRLVEKGP